MSILIWALVGLSVGLAAGAILERQGLAQHAFLGMVGAIIGGWLHAGLTRTPVTVLDLLGALFALAGAVLFLLAARSLTRGRAAI